MENSTPESGKDTLTTLAEKRDGEIPKDESFLTKFSDTITEGLQDFTKVVENISIGADKATKLVEEVLTGAAEEIKVALGPEAQKAVEQEIEKFGKKIDEAHENFKKQVKEVVEKRKTERMEKKRERAEEREEKKAIKEERKEEKRETQENKAPTNVGQGKMAEREAAKALDNMALAWIKASGGELGRLKDMSEATKFSYGRKNIDLTKNPEMARTLRHYAEDQARREKLGLHAKNYGEVKATTTAERLDNALREAKRAKEAEAELRERLGKKDRELEKISEKTVELGDKLSDITFEKTKLAVEVKQLKSNLKTMQEKQEAESDTAEVKSGTKEEEKPAKQSAVSGEENTEKSLQSMNLEELKTYFEDKLLDTYMGVMGNLEKADKQPGEAGNKLTPKDMLKRMVNAAKGLDEKQKGEFINFALEKMRKRVIEKRDSETKHPTEISTENNNPGTKVDPENGGLGNNSETDKKAPDTKPDIVEKAFDDVVKNLRELADDALEKKSYGSAEEVAKNIFENTEKGVWIAMKNLKLDPAEAYQKIVKLRAAKNAFLQEKGSDEEKQKLDPKLEPVLASGEYMQDFIYYVDEATTKIKVGDRVSLDNVLGGVQKKIDDDYKKDKKISNHLGYGILLSYAASRLEKAYLGSQNKG